LSGKLIELPFSVLEVDSRHADGQRNPTDGCTIRTDSGGNAYVFGVGTDSSLGHNAFELMSVSRDGGKSWSKAQAVAGPVTQPGTFDPNVGRAVIDGLAGARSDLAPAPSVDISNGAPTLDFRAWHSFLSNWLGAMPQITTLAARELR